MGLTAIVYETEKRISEKYNISKLFFDTEPTTKEVYLKSDKKIDIGFENIYIEIFLGNLTKIQFLLIEIANILRQDSIVLSKILYNGSHSGDLIPHSDLEKLSSEVDEIKKQYTKKDNEVIDFIHNIEKLIVASDETKNPIVFV